MGSLAGGLGFSALSREIVSEVSCKASCPSAVVCSTVVNRATVLQEAERTKQNPRCLCSDEDN